MTVGYFAPLPPARSGVADYAADLLPLLPARVNAPGDVNLYHIGNNQLHRDIYARALREPGVVVLHDAVLHHFFLGSLDESSYVEEFVYNYGEWARELARELWRDRARSATDPRYFRYGMLRRLVERSRLVIVHNAEAALRVGEKARVIPHYFKPPVLPDGWRVERWRAERGLRPSTMLFGVMGYLRESKRVMAVLRVFARLRAARKDVWLLVAGEAGSSDLRRAMEPLVAGEGVLREEYLEEGAFQMRATACDVGVNLRYPAAGESSGLTARWMQLGRPVLVSETVENAGLPLAGCPRVATGGAEEEGLAAMMLWLADSPVRRRECGRSAREWAEREMRLDAVAGRYWRVLEEAAG